jgi:Spy/CpxP family protein refolding chaperone
MDLRKTLIAVVVGTTLGAGSTLVAAQTGDYGYGPYGMGPGMMYGNGGYYGMGPGMMYGYGGGYGMGPGYGGYGGGYGPGYGMGPGMMYGYGGYGMGPGMMYGYGYGPRGYGWGAGLNLTDEQRGKIGKIQQDLRSKQWDLMGKIQDEYARGAAAPDEAAAGKADDQIAALQQQMFNNAADARKQMDAVLTKEQRQTLGQDGY